MLSLPPALQPLAALDQFVCWFAEPHPVKAGKFNKFPCDWRTGEVINAHDPQYWTSAATAGAMADAWDRGHGAGLGFVFTANDPFFFLDIDSALTPAGWSPLAVQLCQQLAGAAVEVSHSGQGLHVIGRTRPIEHGKKNSPLGLEFYTSLRFVALTGNGAVGSAMTDCSAGVETMVAAYFPPTEQGTFAGWTTGPVEEWGGPTDDEDLIARALASGQKNAAAAFGGDAGPTFSDLWNANPEPLGRKWPPDPSSSNLFDHSHADMALANHLAYWTGKDCERMERLMRRSALVREKWDVHRTYLADTITRACAFVVNVATKRDVPVQPAGAPPPPEVIAQAAAAGGFRLREQGREYIGVHDQPAFFQGCVYVESLNKVYCLPRAALYGKSEFDVVYGGHLFIVSPDGSKFTDSAWEAFTRSRVLAPEIVTKLCFRPEHGPGARIHEGPDVLLNTWTPYHPVTVEGDPTPFLDMLRRMLPDENDRKILLSYMASLVQNPGVKFQWWPVLQGTEGNGKTLIIRALAYAMGDRYTHLPNAAAMAKDGLKFNGWVDGRLFIGVEEIKVNDRRDFLEEFKTVVTNDRLPIERKGVDQVTGDNRVNGVCCTNHRDGVPVTVDGRRYAIFYTAQQSFADIMRDNMDGRYFPDLYDWAKGRGEWSRGGPNYGYAVIAHYLFNYQLEAAYDPARDSIRAPATTSSREAIVNSRGRAEQEIIEAIEQGRPGFANGWISSIYLDHLLREIRVHIPRTKRRDVLRSLGYEVHPHLKDGRVNDTVMPDQGKPVLYLKTGHLALNLQRPSEIAKAYAKAQEPGSGAASEEPSPAEVAFLGPRLTLTKPSE